MYQSEAIHNSKSFLWFLWYIFALKILIHKNLLTVCVTLFERQATHQQSQWYVEHVWSVVITYYPNICFRCSYSDHIREAKEYTTLKYKFSHTKPSGPCRVICGTPTSCSVRDKPGRPPMFLQVLLVMNMWSSFESLTLCSWASRWVHSPQLNKYLMK